MFVLAEVVRLVHVAGVDHLHLEGLLNRGVRDAEPEEGPDPALGIALGAPERLVEVVEDRPRVVRGVEGLDGDETGASETTCTTAFASFRSTCHPSANAGRTFPCS